MGVLGWNVHKDNQKSTVSNKSFYKHENLIKHKYSKNTWNWTYFDIKTKYQLNAKSSNNSQPKMFNMATLEQSKE